ncbi:MAG: hypothetical protein WCC53_05085 [Thermoanaerobaculia bacterium]|jgi:hypothetical protein
MSSSTRSLVLAALMACAVPGRVAGQVPLPTRSPGANAVAARYVAETGADLASLENHFQKYRQAAEKLSDLYAKLSAKAAEVGRIAQAAGAGGGAQSQLLEATKQMQETQMSFNLQYLQLQSQMQNENRSYTAVSNIMKTKHDTVKNSISNVR